MHFCSESRSALATLLQHRRHPGPRQVAGVRVGSRLASAAAGFTGLAGLAWVIFSGPVFTPPGSFSPG